LGQLRRWVAAPPPGAPRRARCQALPADHRYFDYQDTVNAGGVPSEQIIEMNREAQGREYRLQPEGEHPIADLREAAETGAR
jgi:hypothetical protein